MTKEAIGDINLEMLKEFSEAHGISLMQMKLLMIITDRLSVFRKEQKMYL